jgi:hypothetical protein
MSNRLDSKPQVWKLAVDLGLSASGSPFQEILKFVSSRIKRISKKFHCKTLNDLLIATAAEMETTFEEIHSEEDLRRILTSYLDRGETAFANLEAELQGAEDYGITIRRTHREQWEPLFVSVIDCRGDKIFRRYFTKWHELAHLLTLTPQMRLVFRRSHSASSARDPEEILMDVIAGEAGFHSDFLPGKLEGGISFDTILRIKDECCPDASVQAATIGIAKALPIPCILLEASMALRKQESAASHQLGLGLGETLPKPALRAVHASVNRAARDAGICFYKNWRVPSESVISRVFVDGGDSEADEDLSWWTTSGGGSLNPCPVRVKAKKSWDSVQALIIPEV